MTSIARVKLMDGGGERNLALRDALGLVEGETGKVDRNYRVQLVVDGEERARQLADELTDPSVFQREDGRWVVWERGYN